MCSSACCSSGVNAAAGAGPDAGEAWDGVAISGAGPVSGIFAAPSIRLLVNFSLRTSLGGRTPPEEIRLRPVDDLAGQHDDQRDNDDSRQRPGRREQPRVVVDQIAEP